MKTQIQIQMWFDYENRKWQGAASSNIAATRTFDGILLEDLIEKLKTEMPKVYLLDKENAELKRQYREYVKGRKEGRSDTINEVLGRVEKHGSEQEYDEVREWLEPMLLVEPPAQWWDDFLNEQRRREDEETQKETPDADR